MIVEFFSALILFRVCNKTWSDQSNSPLRRRKDRHYYFQFSYLFDQTNSSLRLEVPIEGSDEGKKQLTNVVCFGSNVRIHDCSVSDSISSLSHAKFQILDCLGRLEPFYFCCFHQSGLERAGWWLVDRMDCWDREDQMIDWQKVWRRIILRGRDATLDCGLWGAERF